jgi:spore coat polysaccharide biosynthesis protein SpsF
MSVALFVQARLNSKRLPRKMLMEIEGKSLLEHCLLSSKRIHANNYVLLTTKEDYKEFKNIVKKVGFDIVVGPEDDVLKRFAIGINTFKPDKVIRITGDKIILSKSFQENLINGNCDIVSYDENPICSVTGGLYSSNFLLRADAECVNKESREHVKPARYEIPCKVKKLKSPKKYKDYKINFSIDTIQDLDKMIKIYKKIYKEEPIKFSEIIYYIETYQENLFYAKNT